MGNELTLKAMHMKWTDIWLIAEELEAAHPDIDIPNVRFTDLKHMVCDLEEFTGEPAHCNEKLLEAIQAAWIQERE